MTEELNEELNELDALAMFVAAHAQPDPRTGDREPIWFISFAGGSGLQHHALTEPIPRVDEALLEDMHTKGLISIDYSGRGNLKITPTPFGRGVTEACVRVNNPDLIADVGPLVEAALFQAEADNPLAWPAVRPVLAALRLYWQMGGFSQHGIQLFALPAALPDEYSTLFASTIQALVNGGYLAASGELSAVFADDRGRKSRLPGEVVITEKAHTILDGWPGAAPDELVDNLLAVLAVTAAHESDPVRKSRLEALAATIKEVGVSITSEVIAKVVTGGLM